MASLKNRQPQGASDERESLLRETPSEQTPFVAALLADARVAAAYRGERHEFKSRVDGVLQSLRLMVQTDAFLGLAAYRMKVRLRERGIPVLPWIAHRAAMLFGQISIADTAVVNPGVVIPHGQVVIGELTAIAPFTTLLPWVTVGPTRDGLRGPNIATGGQIGTGAKVLGEIEIGANARIGTNAVVLDDVASNTTVVGIPAQPVTE